MNVFECSYAVDYRSSRSFAKSSDLISESCREARGCSQFHLHSKFININAGVSWSPAETPLGGIFKLPVFIAPFTIDLFSKCIDRSMTPPCKRVQHDLSP